MEFEIYCDECRPELFTSRIKSPYFLSIGGIWLPAEIRQKVKHDVKTLRQKFYIWGEIKWKKVSNAALPFYKSIIDYFFSNRNLRFRTILIDSRKVDIHKFHNSDAELGFYKFYYQLIHHWIYDFNNYRIFVDIKTARLPNRLSVLKQVLNFSNLSSNIESIQSLPSNQLILLQITDLLTGAVNAKFNNSIKKNSAKRKLIDHIEKLLGHPIIPTSKKEEKFNIFKIDLQGGW